jgi:hypothetical protein
MLLGSKGGLTRFGDAVRNITTKKIVNKCDSYNILEIINQWRIKLGFVNLISEILEINKKNTEDTSYQYHQRCYCCQY